MNRYKHIVAELGYSRAARISDPRIAEWFGIYAAPPGWYGFPPALLPLLSDGSLPSYLGLWKHWFVRREASFTELSVSDGHQAREIARTDQQFAELMVARLIVARDGIDADVRALAEILEVDDLDRIDRVTLETGDEAKGLRSLPAFVEKTPLASSILAEYDGDFPTPKRSQPRHCCYFEYDRELFQTLPDKPDWLDPGSEKPSLFHHFLAQGDFASAWRTLNSTGWLYPQAAQAFQDLILRSDTSGILARIAEIWISQASEYDTGY